MRWPPARTHSATGVDRGQETSGRQMAKKSGAPDPRATDEDPRRENQMPDTSLPSNPSIPNVPVTPAMLGSLREIVGDKGLILDAHDKQPFLTNWRGSLVGQAAAVVRPANTEEVSKVVKLCHDNGV